MSAVVDRGFASTHAEEPFEPGRAPRERERSVFGNMFARRRARGLDDDHLVALAATMNEGMSLAVC